MRLPPCLQVPADKAPAEQDAAVQRAAEALTAKGFPAQLRSADAGLQGDAASLAERKQAELRGKCVLPGLAPTVLPSFFLIFPAI